MPVTTWIIAKARQKAGPDTPQHSIKPYWLVQPKGELIAPVLRVMEKNRYYKSAKE